MTIKEIAAQAASPDQLVFALLGTGLNLSAIAQEMDGSAEVSEGIERAFFRSAAKFARDWKARQKCPTYRPSVN